MWCWGSALPEPPPVEARTSRGNATREAMTDGSTVSELAWRLERLITVPEHKLSQPVELLKVCFNAEESAYAGCAAEVLVDPSDEHRRIELIFDWMLDCHDARGWIVSVLDTAASTLAAGQKTGFQREVESTQQPRQRARARDNRRNRRIGSVHHRLMRKDCFRDRPAR